MNYFREKTFTDLLNYASGFKDDAFKASVKVAQLTAKERKVKDLYESEYGTYNPQSGDEFTVDKIINRFENRVIISGAVYRAGFFELDSNMTLKELIEKADGLRDDAYTTAWPNNTC